MIHERLQELVSAKSNYINQRISTIEAYGTWEHNRLCKLSHLLPQLEMETKSVITPFACSKTGFYGGYDEFKIKDETKLRILCRITTTFKMISALKKCADKFESKNGISISVESINEITIWI